jgi:hypothetical protein
MMAIKQWCSHEDKVLSILCNGIMNRKLLKIKYLSSPIDEKYLQEIVSEVRAKYILSDE